MNYSASKKIRDRGYTVGTMKTGKKNCITDVEGVKVGHVTLDFPMDGDDYACTGVTAILPHGGNLFQEKVVAASYVINGYGKTAGLIQVNELGVIESPIMLTNTFGVPAVTQGTLEYMLEMNPEIGDTTGTINIVTGECNDGILNSIRKFPVQSSHAIEAITSATPNLAGEGAIGAGKGMVCFGYKGGIGSSSRVIYDEMEKKEYIIGCMVLTNFGSKDELPKEKFSHGELNGNSISKTSDGSIIIVLATNIPLSDRQLERVAKRCGIGLGRTGSHFGHGSGDIVIAFSTANRISHFSKENFETGRFIREDQPIFNEIFTATAEVTEEAIWNSLSQAETTHGREGKVVEKLFQF
ncbi:DmpA family aminopeptidase [Bacillus sp. FJAT-29937]|uniref:DmpA family aminopeptidase n=1 Tax=Bacillus sp. FJAT-29937 TaxID=1720553 RepID=UPI0008351724|nr:P1 family peptidase [Bacillus sp. FJAT-29937]